ncbi:MAG: hypothetical protein KDB07_03685, partial [Planctomycetes bacterium]|nr:hypothetical protein [Planctomycetota bacterium]
IAKMVVWVRSDPSKPFREASGEFKDGEFIFDLPESDTDYEFAVTVENNAGLAEPVPSVAERRYEHDVQAPVVEIKLIDPVTQREVRSYIREDHHTADDFPRIHVRVSDLHFPEANTAISLVVSRQGVQGNEAIDTSRIRNGEWIEIAPVPVLRAEELTVRLSAADSHGNQNAAEARLTVTESPKWQVVGLQGAAAYYTRTQHYLYWRSNDAVSRDGTVDLYIQRYELVGDTNELEAVGERRPLGMKVEDNGVFYIEGGLPADAGFYKIVLVATDNRDRERVAESAKPFKVVEPAPLMTFHPNESAKLRSTQEGEPAEYVLSVNGPSVHKIDIKDEDNLVGWYPLAPAKDGLRLRYRFQSPTSDTPAGWQERIYDVTTRPQSQGTTLELGSYSIDFPPIHGEGRYEVMPVFVDAFGHRGIWANSPDPSRGVILTYDGGAPTVTLDTGLSKRSYYTEEDLTQLLASAEDPLLVRESVRLEYRNSLDGEWKAMPLKEAFKVDTESGNRISGFFKPDFSKANRYYLRLVAEDELGQQGIAELDGPVYAGGANYVASWPLPMNPNDAAYTNKKFSRRPGFRVRVDPVNPWPEPVGLQSLTLWWRIAPDSPHEKLDQWRPINFDRQWLIGQMNGEWLLPGTKGHEISLPFKAERSGLYQFVVTSSSMYDQLEEPEREAVFGRPRMIPRDTEPEYQATVYVAGSAVLMDMPARGPSMVEEQVISLQQGRVQQLETYEITWSYTTSKENVTNIEDVIFTLEFFDGSHWQSMQALIPAPLGDPKIGLMTFISESESERNDMLGNPVVIRRYRAYWKCPPVVEDVEGFAAKLRIKAEERTKNDLPPMVYAAESPRFRIGEPRPRRFEVKTDYYTAKMADGRKEFADGKFWEAIRHYRDARLERDTTEANLALAEAYDKVGDHTRAQYHRDHAGRPGVVDILR